MIVWLGMEHSSSLEASLTSEQAELLLDTAEIAIRASLKGTLYLGPDVELLPERLRQPCGAFVTLHVDGQLNGCIGNIGSDEPIGACVPKLAIQAAFEDSRLPRLKHQDLPGLQIEISLLSPRSVVPSATADQLLEHLTPHLHGLIIASGRLRALFLPSVWEQIPEPKDFLGQLLRKAGMATDPWPTDMRAEVFTADTYGRRTA